MAQVEMAEVSARAKDTAHLTSRLKTTVQNQIAGLDTKKVRGGPFLVAATLVRLDRRVGKYGQEVTAVIETSLRHKAQGTLIGTVTGRATAASHAESTSALEQSALDAATESALQGAVKVLSK